MTRLSDKVLGPIHPNAVAEPESIFSADGHFPVHRSIPQEKNPHLNYWAIWLGTPSGRKRERIFYKHLLFHTSALAEFFYRQEMFLSSERRTFAYAEIVRVYEYEVSEREDLVVYDLPDLSSIMLSDFALNGGLMIPVALHGDRDEPDTIYYSGRIGLFSHGTYMDSVLEDNAENVANMDAILMGIRLSPAIFVPDRRKYLCFREDGLPGAWAVNLGIRNESDSMGTFSESFEETLFSIQKKIIMGGTL